MIKLRTLGDPILKQRAEPVPLGVSVTDTVDRMMFLMRVHDGLGLSAQQAGSTQRVALMKLKDQEDPSRYEIVVALNLEILERSPEMQVSKDEGCLSVQSRKGAYFRRDVERHVWVIIAYEDLNRYHRIRKCTNLDAVIAQHEYEHLEGRCIVDGLTREERKASYRAQTKARRR